jgi:hypothetical protein
MSTTSGEPSGGRDATPADAEPGALDLIEFKLPRLTWGNKYRLRRFHRLTTEQKFALSVLQCQANFGNGALVDTEHL